MPTAPGVKGAALLLVDDDVAAPVGGRQRRRQPAELDLLTASQNAQRSLAKNCTGLPFD
jgi:hypothetical protein